MQLRTDFGGNPFGWRRIQCSARRCSFLLNRPIETFGLGLWFGADFTPQSVTAKLVLLECQRGLALFGVDLHEGAMSDLPQGIQPQQPPRDRCGLVVCATRHLQIEQPRQPVARKGAQALALHEQPIIESRITNIEAIEQIAPIERRRASNGL
jgi:hypothetical protein